MMGSLTGRWSAVAFPLQQNLRRGCGAPSRLQCRRLFSPLAWYNKQLSRAPLITKSITSGGISITSGGILLCCILLGRGEPGSINPSILLGKVEPGFPIPSTLAAESEPESDDNILPIAVLFTTGDVLAQTVTMEKGGKYNCPRAARAAVFGTFLLGPLAHLHFNFIEWLIVKKLAFTGTKMAMSKMFIDQFTYWAAGINAVYLFSLPLMGGESREKAWHNVRVNIWPILKANWCLWPLAQLINFRLVPVAHQLNFVLTISLGWATYLSWSTS